MLCIYFVEFYVSVQKQIILFVEVECLELYLLGVQLVLVQRKNERKHGRDNDKPKLDTAPLHSRHPNSKSYRPIPVTLRVKRRERWLCGMRRCSRHLRAQCRQKKNQYLCSQQLREPPHGSRKVLATVASTDLDPWGGSRTPCEHKY